MIPKHVLHVLVAFILILIQVHVIFARQAVINARMVNFAVIVLMVFTLKLKMVFKQEIVFNVVHLALSA